MVLKSLGYRRCTQTEASCLSPLWHCCWCWIVMVFSRYRSLSCVKLRCFIRADLLIDFIVLFAPVAAFIATINLEVHSLLVTRTCIIVVRLQRFTPREVGGIHPFVVMYVRSTFRTFPYLLASSFCQLNCLCCHLIAVTLGTRMQLDRQ